MTLTFPALSNALDQQTFLVPILDDSTVENLEDIDLGAVIIFGSAFITGSTITIQDNDGEC